MARGFQDDLERLFLGLFRFVLFFLAAFISPAATHAPAWTDWKEHLVQAEDYRDSA